MMNLIPMTEQDRADRSLVQHSVGYNFTLHDVNLVETRRYTDGEHRFYSVCATSTMRHAQGTIVIIEMVNEPVRVVRQGFYYDPR